jgi:elongator complex protein 3
VHFMANLLGSTPDADTTDYLRLVTDERFLPDEVKLYPCCLVESSRLGAFFESGAWQPYGEDELVDLLVADTLATPAYTRISRMIRDISSTDIVAGNKKTNLRQMVEARITGAGAKVREIRMREVATSDVAPSDLRLDCVSYHTTVSDERFLQWVTPEGRIAGFLRLSLPLTGTEAMIREVHVYGRVAGLGASERGGAQHVGLGRSLVEEACRRAHEAGFAAINVISAIGTRNYYRGLGFYDAGLYQRRLLA